MVGTENKDMSEGSNEDKQENTSFGENSKIFEMDCLETVPFDGEEGVDYESEYTI
jgi:hypothetical protein